jgi:hypothetical protein
MKLVATMLAKLQDILYSLSLYIMAYYIETDSPIITFLSSITI